MAENENPLFGPYQDVWNLKSIVSDQENNDGRQARKNCLCFGTSTEDDVKTFKDIHERILAAMYKPLLDDTTPSATWSLPDVAEHIVGGYLIPDKLPGGSLTLSLISPAIIIPGDRHKPSYLVGLKNQEAFTRTHEFDTEGLTGPDTRLTIASYSKVSKINRFRFISHTADRSTISDLRDVFVKKRAAPTDDDPDAVVQNREDYAKVSSGTHFLSATSSDSNWFIQNGIERSTGELSIPAVFPVPIGHNITIIKEILSSSTDPHTLLDCFKEAGVDEEADLSWLLNNPIFKVWHQNLTLDCTHSLPSKLLSSSLNSISSREIHEAAIKCLRLVGADWMSTVKEDPSLINHLQTNPDLLSNETFPPDNIQVHFTIPPMKSQFPVRVITIDDTVTDPPPQITPPSIPRGSPTSLSSSRPATPHDLTFHPMNFDRIQRRTHNEASLKKILVWGLIDHSSRINMNDDASSNPLVATINGLHLHSKIEVTGGITDIPQDLQSYYMCAPLRSNLLSFLLAAPKPQVSQLATDCKARFIKYVSNVQPTLGKNFMSTLNNFFCPAIFQMLASGAIAQVPISGAQHMEQFSLLHVALLHKAVRPATNSSAPLFPEEGFDSFEDISSIFLCMKWLLMTLFHQKWYTKTILFRGLTYMEEQCNLCNFSVKWSQDHTFHKKRASYIIVHYIHSLSAHLGNMAATIPEDELKEAYYSLDTNQDLKPCHLCPPTVLEDNGNVILDTDLEKWRGLIPQLLQSCSITDENIFMNNMQTGAIPHLPDTLFFRKRTTDDRSSSDSSSEDSEESRQKKRSRKRRKKSKKAKRDKEKKEREREKDKDKRVKPKPTSLPNPAMHILQPSKTSSISEIIELSKKSTKFECRIPSGKTFNNLRSNCRFCIKFLLGEDCHDQDCGYHLWICPTLTAKKERWTFFLDWLDTCKDHLELTSNAKDLYQLQRP